MPEQSFNLRDVAGIGTVIAYWGDEEPSGSEGETWALCDGSEVSRTECHELFSLVGVVFGSGDRQKTFNLPDLRGRFLRGLDWAQDPKKPVTGEFVSSKRDPELKERTSMASGEVVGPEIGSLQESSTEAHQHYLSGKVACDPWEYSDDSCTCFLPNNGFGAWGETLAAGGSETRPVNIYVNYIIRIK
jgi:hypothetical protein